MTSAKDVLEMTRGADGTFTIKQTHQDGGEGGGGESQSNRPPSADEGTVVPTVSSLTGDGGGGSLDEYLALAEQLGGGGLTFEQQMELEGLRNAGGASIASISGGIQQAIANMQEAGAHGRYLYGTEAEARTAAQTFSENIKTSLAQMLSEQGYSTPALALAKGPESARLALIEALRSGSLMPTMARQELLAKAAANPSDVMGLLALTAGQGEYSPDEQALQEKLSFNLPKSIEEGRTARGGLAESLEGMESLTFDELLARLLPLVKPPPPPPAAGGGGGGGYGGGYDGEGEAVPELTQGVESRSPYRNLTDTQRRAFQGTTPGQEVGVISSFQQLAAAEFERRKMPGTDTYLEALGVYLRTGSIPRNLPRNITSAPRRTRLALATSLRNTLREIGVSLSDSLRSKFGAVRRIGEILKKLNLKETRYKRSTASTSYPGLRAKGGANYDPGYFIIGEGKNDEGLHAGTAEYAFLPPGSVVAPIGPGEDPTMDNAKQAIMAMILKDKGAVPQRAAVGGVTAEEDVLKEQQGALTTLFGTGGIFSKILSGERRIGSTLGGYKMRALPDFQGALEDIDPALRGKLFGGASASKFPFAAFLNMTPEMKEAVMGVLGPAYGDSNILASIMGLHQMLRGKAFSGAGTISRVR